MVSRFIAAPSLHPLIFLMLVFMAGIMAQHIQLSLQIPILIFMGVGICFLYLYKFSAIAWLCLIATAYIGGAVRYQIHTQRYHEVHTRLTQNTFTLKGVIIDKQEPGGKIKIPTVTIRLTQCNNKDLDDLALHNFTLVATTSKAFRLKVDDIVELQSIELKKPSSANYRYYLLKEHCLGHIFIKNEKIKLLNRPTYSFNRWLYEHRSTLVKRIQAKLSPKTFTLFASLFLGAKQSDRFELEAVQDTFKLWGISHYLARSGLHVTLFVALWSLIATGFFLGAYMRFLLLLLVVVAYSFLSWPTLSFIRAVGMFGITCFLQTQRIRNKITHSTALVAGCMLLYNPLYLFFLDFQFTFLLTFALGWLLECQKASKPLHESFQES